MRKFGNTRLHLISIGLLWCLPLSANSIGVKIAGSTTGVIDGQPSDELEEANAIRYRFDVSPEGKGYRIQGTILANTDPGVSATTVITDLIVENQGDDTISDLLLVTHNFPGIGGFSNEEIPLLNSPSTSASLAGEYNNDSGRIGFADVVLRPFAVRNTPDLVPVGSIDPAPASNETIGEDGPPSFDGSSGPIDAAPVTQHRAELEFQLGSNGDNVRLPASATIATVSSTLDIPTLSQEALAVFGALLCFMASLLLLRARG